MIILIMGLPGSGKTTHAKKLVVGMPSVTWLNADEVRKEYDDWDFSEEGRLRQAKRIRKLAEEAKTSDVLIDMVAALKAQRDILNPEFIIWMDTIEKGRFEDTNQAFDPPENYHQRITQWT